MDDSRVHKSQILRVSRVNPMSGEVVAANASLRSVYDQRYRIAASRWRVMNEAARAADAAAWVRSAVLVLMVI
jgi:hypothetical protein